MVVLWPKCGSGVAKVWQRCGLRCGSGVAQYTTSVDINNTRYERIQSLIQNHMRHVRSESAREQRIALYKSYE